MFGECQTSFISKTSLVDLKKEKRALKLLLMAKFSVSISDGPFDIFKLFLKMQKLGGK
jgi:hypothetical protein